MRIASAVATLTAFVSLGALGCATISESVPDGHIAPNDNRKPAGTLKNGVLSVSLEARKGTFYPEGATGVGVPAFAWPSPANRCRARVL